MSARKYVVLTPLRQAGDKRGTTKLVPPGQAVMLDDDDAVPLLTCGAVRLSDENPDPAAE